MKCNNVDLNTLIEMNQSEINKMQSTKNQFPFIGGDINRLTKENEQINTLINHLTK